MNGKTKRNRKISGAGIPWADVDILCAEITMPVLYRTQRPKIGPAMGMNIARQIIRLFPKMYCTLMSARICSSS